MLQLLLEIMPQPFFDQKSYSLMTDVNENEQVQRG
jgi:hypothetical protein